MIEKTTLFIGLNDKDTKTQLISIIAASKIASNILRKYNLDCTITESIGIYTHENGVVVTENTLRVELLFCNKEKILPVIPELKNVLNQETIAAQFDIVDSDLF